MKRRAGVLVLCAGAFHASAAEVDNITARWIDEVKYKDQPERRLPDASAVLNAEVRRRLAEAVAARNAALDAAKPKRDQAPPSCGHAAEREAMEQALLERFRGGALMSNFRGEFEAWAEKSDELKDYRRVIPYEETIYRDSKLLSAPALAVTGLLGSSLRVGDYYVGSDKFGHFFTHGHRYQMSYRNFYDPEKDQTPGQLGRVLKARRAERAVGRKSESGPWGLYSTATYSYADMNANAKGRYFWDRVLPDPKGADRAPPYLECSDGRWRVSETSTFQLQDYVTAAWDESINCSSFKEAAALRIEKRVRELYGASEGPACPVVKNGCEPLKDVPSLDMVTPVCRDFVAASAASAPGPQVSPEADADGE